MIRMGIIGEEVDEAGFWEKRRTTGQSQHCNRFQEIASGYMAVIGDHVYFSILESKSESDCKVFGCFIQVEIAESSENII